jgi:hypothetical protein
MDAPQARARCNAMKKAGFTVESFKPEGGVRTYRIKADAR